MLVAEGLSRKPRGDFIRLGGLNQGHAVLTAPRP